MPINITMPALSPTMEEGNLAKWLVKEGDTVKSGDVIAEIETDKATMEVEAVDEGTVAKIVVPAGTEGVKVNSLIAVLAADGEDVKAAAASGSGAAAPAPKAEPAAHLAPQRLRHAAASEPPGLLHRASRQLLPPLQRLTARTFSSPLARRLAKEAGIDIVGDCRLRPAWPRRQEPTSKLPFPAVVQRLPPRLLRLPHAAAAAAPKGASTRPFSSCSRRAPTSSCRMTACARRSPSRLRGIQADRAALLRLRRLRTRCADGAARPAQFRRAPRRTASRPTSSRSTTWSSRPWRLPCAMFRMPTSPGRKPAMVKHKHADVGVAVSIPGGLITPIIRQAETKTLSAISNEMKDLGKRAKERKLKPKSIRAARPSVSNMGMMGVKHFAAVINPPHATDPARSAPGEQRVVVKNGEMAIATVDDGHAVDRPPLRRRRARGRAAAGLQGLHRKPGWACWSEHQNGGRRI